MYAKYPSDIGHQIVQRHDARALLWQRICICASYSVTRTLIFVEMPDVHD